MMIKFNFPVFKSQNVNYIKRRIAKVMIILIANIRFFHVALRSLGSLSSPFIVDRCEA